MSKTKSHKPKQSKTEKKFRQPFMDAFTSDDLPEGFVTVRPTDYLGVFQGTAR